MEKEEVIGVNRCPLGRALLPPRENVGFYVECTTGSAEAREGRDSQSLL